MTPFYLTKFYAFYSSFSEKLIFQGENKDKSKLLYFDSVGDFTPDKFDFNLSSMIYGDAFPEVLENDKLVFPSSPEDLRAPYESLFSQQESVVYGIVVGKSKENQDLYFVITQDRRFFWGKFPEGTNITLNAPYCFENLIRKDSYYRVRNSSICRVRVNEEALQKLKFDYYQLTFQSEELEKMDTYINKAIQFFRQNDFQIISLFPKPTSTSGGKTLHRRQMDLSASANLALLFNQQPIPDSIELNISQKKWEGE